MAYFNEDNVTKQMCIEVVKQAGYEYIKNIPGNKVTKRKIWNKIKTK